MINAPECVASLRLQKQDHENVIPLMFTPLMLHSTHSRRPSPPRLGARPQPCPRHSTQAIRKAKKTPQHAAAALTLGNVHCPAASSAAGPARRGLSPRGTRHSHMGRAAGSEPRTSAAAPPGSRSADKPPSEAEATAASAIPQRVLLAQHLYLNITLLITCTAQQNSTGSFALTQSNGPTQAALITMHMDHNSRICSTSLSPDAPVAT